MSIKKQFLKSKPICKVTFRIPEELGNASQKANVVGEFNGWSLTANPMKRLRNGTFKVTINLEKDREYQFRYLLEKEQWVNDPDADRFVPTPYGDSENSVIIL